MQAVFVLLKKWSYTVILGNVLGIVVAVGNFLVMGISVQKAVTLKVEDAKKLMATSKKYRTIGMFAIIAIGAVLSIFNTASVIIPVFFPRIAIAFRPLIKDKKEVINK